MKKKDGNDFPSHRENGHLSLSGKIKYHVYRSVPETMGSVVLEKRQKKEKKKGKYLSWRVMARSASSLPGVQLKFIAALKSYITCPEHVINQKWWS